MKIKLGKQVIKKDDGQSVEDASTAAQRGPTMPPAYTNGSNGATGSHAAAVQPVSRPISLGKASISGNVVAPGGPSKVLKLKTSSGPIPGLSAPRPGAGQGPKSAPLKLKQMKRPGGPLNLAAPPPAAGPGNFGPPPKKIKLGNMGAPKLKLKTTGTLNLTGAAIPSIHLGLGITQLPPRPPAGPPPISGPKRRGRKRKDDPESLANRQARMVDEVTYKIASPPPRQHSLRQSVSHSTLGEGGPHVGEGILGPLGLDFIPPLPPSGAGGGGDVTMMSPMEMLPYVPEELPVPDFPVSPPTKEELNQLIAKVWEKDLNGLFHTPVTDEVVSSYWGF